jgi:hypothetical protein
MLITDNYRQQPTFTDNKQTITDNKMKNTDNKLTNTDNKQIHSFIVFFILLLKIASVAQFVLHTIHSHR